MISGHTLTYGDLVQFECSLKNTIIAFTDGEDRIFLPTKSFGIFVKIDSRGWAVFMTCMGLCAINDVYVNKVTSIGHNVKES